MVQRMVPAAKIARADKISKSPSAPPGERPPARSHLQAPESRTCDKKHRAEHPACPNRSKRGPDAPSTLRPSGSPLAAPGHFLPPAPVPHPPASMPFRSTPLLQPHQPAPTLPLSAGNRPPHRTRPRPIRPLHTLLPARAGLRHLSATSPFRPAPATRFPHTGRHPRPAQHPKCRKISVRTKKFRRRTLHSLRFLLSLHPL